MQLRLISAIFCLAASAAAQTPATLEALAGTEWPARPFWIAVDDAKGGFLKALSAALDEDRTSALGLRLHVLSAKSHPALMQELAARHGWATGPRWALVSTKGQVLAQGAKPPTADDLMVAALGAGVRPRVQVLETFLQAHPDHVEAMEELLATQMRLASKRMERFLEPRKGAPPQNDSEDFGRTLKRPLTREEDERIWGPSARLMTRMFAEELIHLNGQPIASLPEVAALSPLMQDTARKALPVLETWIQRDPRRWSFWMMWRSLNRWTGHTRSARRLLESAPPIPGRLWYQADAVRAFNHEAMAAKDWNGLVGFLQPVWEREVEEGMGRRVEEDSASGSFYIQFYWDQFGPLAEAHLRLGDERNATRVVEGMVQVTGFKSLARRAADLATALKRPDLAQRWGTLGGKNAADDHSVKMGGR